MSVEQTTPQDPYLDYCLWPYDPPSSGSGKLRSSNLLHHTFTLGGEASALIALTATIRRAMGPFNTVWGVKRQGEALSWEYYFYDYRRLERERSITHLLTATGNHFECRLPVNEQRPYFMFSVDIDRSLAAGERTLDEINIYLGNIGSSVSSGICYSQTAERLRMDNLYYFFDARREWETITGKIACSAYLDLPGLDLEQVLWPEMVSCQTIVVANKKLCDGVYFSRVSVDQLLYFLRRLAWPAEHIAYIEANRERLDHLLYDVGIDYRMEDGVLTILKSAYYGIF